MSRTSALNPPKLDAGAKLKRKGFGNMGGVRLAGLGKLEKLLGKKPVSMADMAKYTCTLRTKGERCREPAAKRELRHGGPLTNSQLYGLADKSSKVA